MTRIQNGLSGQFIFSVLDAYDRSVYVQKLLALCKKDTTVKFVLSITSIFLPSEPIKQLIKLG